ncbi:hypothetical protein [Streptomyces sp. NPDC007988]
MLRFDGRGQAGVQLLKEAPEVYGGDAVTGLADVVGVTNPAEITGWAIF